MAAVCGAAIVGASLDLPHFPPTAYVILPPAASTTYSTTPEAQPGDTLYLFASGLGPAAVRIAQGLVFTGAYAFAQTPAISMGGFEAEILRSALISPGLF